jgi:hypothetical protein
MGSMPFNTIHILGCSSSMHEEPIKATRNPKPPRPTKTKKLKEEEIRWVDLT